MMATTTAKNAISLEEQNNNFARASDFFVHFFAVLRHDMTKV